MKGMKWTSELRAGLRQGRVVSGITQVGMNNVDDDEMMHTGREIDPVATSSLCTVTIGSLLTST